VTPQSKIKTQQEKTINLVKSFKSILFFALISGLGMAQSSPTAPAKNNSDPSILTGQVEQLRQTMAAQQKAMAEQQKQLEEQQRELDRLRLQLSAQSAAVAANAGEGSGAQRIANTSLSMPANANAVADTRLAQETEPQKESPLSFRIGAAEFSPGGFMDFTSIFRTTNTGNPGGTNFYAIPFSNSVAGHLTENRFTAANSRISLKATSNVGKNHVIGYYEADFLGNDPSNVFVTSNSHTFRSRLYFVDLKRDKFELVAGQTWGWLTPNRVGLGPLPSDVFYSQNMDMNYQVGLTWTRQAGIRFVYHPNTNWAMGVALENPQQFAGQGEVTFPQFFQAQLINQLDQGSATTTGSAVPNLHPDIIPKIGYDTDVAGKHFHVEVAGLLTAFRITNLVNGEFGKHTKEGGGISGAVNLEIAKNFHFVSNAFWSNGGGRYIFGMGPGVVVLPANAPGTTCTLVASGVPPNQFFTPTGCDVALSLVHSGSGIVGFEWQATPKTMFTGYYGAAYFQRNFARDITNPNPNAFVGFGGPNSNNGSNRAIQEPTLGWIQTFWKSEKYGALQFITQASYVTRSPWFVAAGAPKNAHLVMGWLDLRYVLP
jgi:hypothetical protein